MSNDFRRQKRRTAPLDKDGRYCGDIQVDSLRRFLEEGHFCDRWSGIAIDMGYEPIDYEPTSLQHLHWESRFIRVVLDAGIWYLAELSALLQDNSSRRVFLEDVLDCASTNDRNVVAIPHDILVFLVLHDQRNEFIKEEIEQLGYTEALTTALLALLKP